MRKSNTIEWTDYTTNLVQHQGLEGFELNTDEARRILTEDLDNLHSVAKALLEFETLSGDEIIGVMKGETPKRDEDESNKETVSAPSLVPLSPGAGASVTA